MEHVRAEMAQFVGTDSRPRLTDASCRGATAGKRNESAVLVKSVVERQANPNRICYLRARTKLHRGDRAKSPRDLTQKGIGNPAAYPQ